MSTSHNHDPFYDRGAVHDPERFIGRVEELYFIYNLLQKRQCVSIVGSSFMGKSSLLQLLGNPKLQQRVGYDMHEYMFITLNFADYEQKDKEDFFQDVCKQIMVVCQIELPDSVLTAKDWRTNFRYLLQHMNSMRLHPVLLLDAFDKVARNKEFDLDFFSFLRNLAIRGIVYYVTASINPLAKVCHPGVKTSTFFGIFTECRLGPFTREEAEQLITQLLHDVQHRFTTDDIQWIIEQAGRHPYLLQLTSSALFEGKFRRGLGTVNLVRIRERLYHELSPIFDGIWGKLKEESHDAPIQENESKEQRELKEEARRGSNPERLRNIPELSESQLFRNYVSERFHIDKPDITFEDLEEALNNFHNLDFLSSSRLAETYYVILHFEQGSVQASMKKGNFVQDLINKAYELMSPNGKRNDSAPEWRFCNILYYRYLRYNLDSDNIYPRIGIRSRRDFFRKRKDAITLLLEKVCLIEMATLKGE